MSSKRGGKGQPKGRTYGPKPTLPPNVVIPPQAPEIPPVIEIQQPPQVVQPPTEERRRRRDEFEVVPEFHEAEFFGKELKDWHEHLNEKPKQKDAVEAYSGVHYYPMNRHLRGIEVIDPKGFDSYGTKGSKTLSRIKELDKALKNFDLKKNITVYRGSSAHLIGGLTKASDIKKIIGSEVQDKGFMSTSVGKSSAFSGEIKYEIKVPKGKGRGAYIGMTSHHKGEREFLLARGTKFRITGVKEVENAWGAKRVVVQLKVIGQSKD